MDDVKRKLRGWVGVLEKYKYPFLILVLGVVLMCIPFEQTKEQELLTEAPPALEYDLEERLQEVLAQIDGVGETEVLLSPKTGYLYTYQEDTQIRTTSDSEELEQQTVIMSNAGAERPIETSVTYPTYEGAIVVCGGADKASVKLAVVRAVSGVTGLSADNITVIKMKGY